MSDKLMKVLIYKRTHADDPGEEGVFGISDCMGSFRDWGYNSVIGIGGKHIQKKCKKDIAYKINWIGKCSKKQPCDSKRGPLVTFENFCLLDEKGKLVEKIAPALYKYMYGKKQRRFKIVTLTPDNALFADVSKILDLAKNCPPSIGLSEKDFIKKCKSDAEKGCKPDTKSCR